MKIKQFIKTEREVEVDLPAFWGNNDHTEFLAVINEETVIHIKRWEGYKLIQSATVSVKGDAITDAYQNWISISETEFLEVHESFLQSLSLMPKMIVD